MRTLGWIVCAVLLMADASRDGDGVAMEVASPWVWGRDGAGGVAPGVGWREVMDRSGGEIIAPGV